ncbi:MAG: hypothetical protein AAB488_02140 [Patescibacteria group bacterium]
MPNFKNELFQSLKTLALALILSVGVSYVYAWTGPIGTPPNDNTDAPINTGTVSQVKDGGLSVDAFQADVAAITGVLSSGKVKVIDQVNENDPCSTPGLIAKQSGSVGTGMLMVCNASQWKKLEIDWYNTAPTVYDFTNDRTGAVKTVVTGQFKFCILKYVYIESSANCNITRNSDATWTLTSASAHGNIYFAGCQAYCFR